MLQLQKLSIIVRKSKRPLLERSVFDVAFLDSLNMASLGRARRTRQKRLPRLVDTEFMDMNVSSIAEVATILIYILQITCLIPTKCKRCQKYYQIIISVRQTCLDAAKARLVRGKLFNHV